MDRDRWKRLEQIFTEALELPDSQRTAFLDRACGTDSTLRREVESLMARAQGDGESLQAVIRDAAAETSDWIGRKIGSYEILELLGAGGMGEVYRARDNSLPRSVAIKVLSDDLSHAAMRDRFRNEARIASSINHPHIVTVHEVGEFEGRQYLVTEFVDGGTLRQWAQEQSRTWRQIVDLLTGVADGLASAHGAGMIHRDVKPENILIMKSGYAKLADFGLAKLLERQSADAETVTTTRATVHTQSGLIVGTVGYMSPEQASGAPVDARTDVFSFGVVLYELLAGRRPFAAGSRTDELNRIIHNSPEPLGQDVPLPLRMIVEKALHKDPAERYQTMRDVVVDLRALLRDRPASGMSVVDRPIRRSRVFALAGCRPLLDSCRAGFPILAFTTWYFGIRGSHPVTRCPAIAESLR